MKIGMVFGGVVIAVLGGLVFAGMLPLQIVLFVLAILDIVLKAVRLI